MARQLQIFGVHVHVGVGREEGVPIVNALTAYVPHLLALSASSPYWIGTDTGLASYRSRSRGYPPRAALPALGLARVRGLHGDPHVGRTISSSARSGGTSAAPGFRTVELRIFDGLPTLLEVGAVAAMSQCLVEMLSTQLDRGYTLPVPTTGSSARTNGGPLVTGSRPTSSSTSTAAPSLCARRCRSCSRTLAGGRPFECTNELASAYEILACGPSYERQRRVRPRTEATSTPGRLAGRRDARRAPGADEMSGRGPRRSSGSRARLPAWTR